MDIPSNKTARVKPLKVHNNVVLGSLSAIPKTKNRKPSTIKSKKGNTRKSGNNTRINSSSSSKPQKLSLLATQEVIQNALNHNKTFTFNIGSISYIINGIKTTLPKIITININNIYENADNKNIFKKKLQYSESLNDIITKQYLDILKIIITDYIIYVYENMYLFNENNDKIYEETIKAISVFKQDEDYHSPNLGSITINILDESITNFFSKVSEVIRIAEDKKKQQLEYELEEIRKRRYGERSYETLADLNV